MRSPVRRLARARKGLRFIAFYAHMQSEFVRAGVVSQPETVEGWRERYAEVCDNLRAWAGKALRESRKTAKLRRR